MLPKKEDAAQTISCGGNSNSGRKMMRPRAPAAAASSIWLSLAITIAFVAISSVAIVLQAQAAGEGEGVHAVSSSEISLRQAIENTNKELRKLKLAFMKQTSKIYLQELKLDPIIGAQAAKESGSTESIGLLLMAQEFLTITMKQYIIQRRMLAGLRVLFTKLLPIRTLERLVVLFKSFEWLRGRNKVDVSPSFPDATENQFIQLYGIIDGRARLRAADDIIALTIDNMSRIYKTIRGVLLAAPKEQLSRPEMGALASHSNRLLEYYLREIVAFKSDAQLAFERQMDSARPLIESYGGEQKFLGFVDRTIDTEALDIDLNKEATSLELPPTINEEMIDNIERRWLPSNVLEAANADRAFLLQTKNKRIIKDWVLVSDDHKDGESAPAELARLCEIASSIINSSSSSS